MNIKKINEELIKLFEFDPNEWDETPDKNVPHYYAYNVPHKVILKFEDGTKKEMEILLDIHDAEQTGNYDPNIYGVDPQYAVGGWDGDIEWDEDNVEVSVASYEKYDLPDDVIIEKIIEYPLDGDVDWHEGDIY